MTPLHQAALELCKHPLQNSAKVFPYIVSLTRRKRRAVCEFFGIDSFSKPYPGHSELLETINYKDGFFVECGGNDGLMVDPTYYLEKFRSWKGIIVEPLPKMVQHCKNNRPNSVIVEAALVSNDFHESSIKIIDCNAMSVTPFTTYDIQSWVKKGESAQSMISIERIVPARTLDSVLEEVSPHSQVDLLVIDVEGSEENVLRGFNIERYQPKFILVEIHTPELKTAIETLLGTGYVLRKKLAWLITCTKLQRS